LSWHDTALGLAGVIGSGVAVLHGYLTQRYMVRPDDAKPPTFSRLNQIGDGQMGTPGTWIRLMWTIGDNPLFHKLSHCGPSLADATIVIPTAPCCATTTTAAAATPVRHLRGR